MTQETEYQLVKEFRASGGISVAIWRLDVTNGEGRTIPQYSFKVQKRYKIKNTGEWTGQAMNIFPNEWPKIRAAADEAYDWVTIKDDNSENIAQ